MKLKFNLNCKRRLDQIFLYKHIQTSQVLVTIGRVIKKRYIKQINDAALRPHKLRKDLWAPFIAITGFSSYSSIMTTNNILLNEIRKRPKSPEYHKTEKRLRVHEDMDLVETSVLGLCKSLQQLEVRGMESKEKNSLLKVYWERMEMINLPGLGWPKFVQHEKLELKRGRIFMNHELKSNKKSLAEKKDIEDAKFKRGIYSKKKGNQVNQTNQARDSNEVKIELEK